MEDEVGFVALEGGGELGQGLDGVVEEGFQVVDQFGSPASGSSSVGRVEV